MLRFVSLFIVLGVFWIYSWLTFYFSALYLCLLGFALIVVVLICFRLCSGAFTVCVLGWFAVCFLYSLKVYLLGSCVFRFCLALGLC